VSGPEITIKDGMGKEYTFPLLAKDFKSGSYGYFISGSVLLKAKNSEDQVMHTFTLNIVEKGSKPKEGKKD
jgi:hypothetical protein